MKQLLAILLTIGVLVVAKVMGYQIKTKISNPPQAIPKIVAEGDSILEAINLAERINALNRGRFHAGNSGRISNYQGSASH
jgi:hypothetical protein